MFISQEGIYVKVTSSREVFRIWIACLDWCPLISGWKWLRTIKQILREELIYFLKLCLMVFVIFPVLD